MIFDDGKSLKGFSKSNAVGNNAATKAIELVYRTNNTITLKAVKLLPDHGVADTCSRLDDTLFIKIFVTIAENIIEDKRVNDEGLSMGGE